MKDNFMVDIETMGTRPYSVILSVGVVAFDLKTGEKGKDFYATIDRQSCLDIGLTEDASTIEWWGKQDQEVKAELFKNTLPIKEVLTILSRWLKEDCTGNKYVWGNSASFDLGLLTCAYERCGLPVPWAFWNERCCRTIVALNPGIKDAAGKPIGAHHPINDCKHQIDYVVKTIKSIYK